jgi:hypothetical protein
MIDRDLLRAKLPGLRATFEAAEPFPHIVIDDFLDLDAANQAFDAFPPPNGGEWTHYKHINERKIGRSQVSDFPQIHQRIAATLSEPYFIDFLSELTGMPSLLADPDLEGGGLHQTEPGGFLSVHTDFSAHSRHPSWIRRVNVLLFFNRDWRDEFGGDLEFWDPDVSRCVTRIAPKFNRCVIFPTNARTYHGHPEPLACAPDSTRKSMALYYFDERTEPKAARPTTYRPRPDDSKLQGAMIHADNVLLARYASLKRRFGFSDRFVSRILRRLFR